ncbi:helix-turn-helix transcriptional regulator [Nonomuraea sp. NN258]|uniref:helix-turn-helix domain-containing protein n=1 Tax=Nonomuraea antri TaxID=2730852 RepID=UPI0015684B75|nr:helix-turn-helix transcriptional regulator [Nonomuraea antri]NRQ36941.1 helix-turn-helix transcriptional regulator [Nonomuraea antri]
MADAEGVRRRGRRRGGIVGSGPLAEFTKELRDLHHRAGSPTERALAAKIHFGRTMINETLQGKRLPTPDLLTALVQALGEEHPDRWLQKLNQAQGTPQNPTTPPACPEPAPQPAPPSRPGPARKTLLLASSVMVLLIALVALSLIRPWQAGDSTDPPLTRAITVHNKVVTGADQMREDDTPAYLSAGPRNYCRTNGCKLSDTEVSTGQTLVAHCQTTGERATNGNDSQSNDNVNPGLHTSTRWYGITWRDGRTGYIAEIWIHPDHRGGLNLPAC